MDLSVPGAGSASHRESGVNFLAGTGYAFWLGQSFNLTLNADLTYQAYGGDIKSTNFWHIWLGFDWY